MPVSHPALHTRLQAIEERVLAAQRALEEAHDSRCVFTYAYHIMTEHIDQHLDTANLFAPEWLVLLAETFANRYFAALESYDKHEQLSPAWTAAFDAVCLRNTSVIEDLLFAITAHIVYDLPLALTTIG